MLQQLHALNPYNPAILYDYTLRAFEIGQKAKSILFFQRLLTLAPDRVNGLAAIGVAYASTVRVQDGKEAF